MRTERQLAESNEREVGLVSGMLGLIRNWSHRNRNLAELKNLDAERLQDIGLTEYARAQITCTN